MVPTFIRRMHSTRHDWEIDSELHQLLDDFGKNPAPLRLLVEGPAGCGKTTLVHKAAQRASLTILQFDGDTLACRNAEQVEENVVEVKAEAIERAPCILLVDDADLWLPKQMANPAQFHFLAHLAEAVRELDEEPVPSVALVLVVRNRTELHPALKCQRLRVVPVRPLVESERAMIIRGAVSGNVRDEDIDDVVVRTPGFVTVDMAQLLLEARRIAMSDSLRLEHVDKAIGQVQPLLLGEHGKKWRFSTAGLEKDSLPALHGLTVAETTIRTAMNAAFSRLQHVSLDAMGRVRGILVHGPTGTGKTALLERAATWLARGTVHVLRVDAVDVVDAVIGAAERAITRLFAVARAAAPALLILENLHLLAPRREELDKTRDGGSGAAAAFERILATLLVELDGARRSSEPVVVLASTPIIELVEPAMLRPGRIELHIRTELPNDNARRAIFRDVVSNGLPLETGSSVMKNETLIMQMVRVTCGKTAAYIGSLVSETVFAILRSDGLLADGGAKLSNAAESLTCERVTAELGRRIMEIERDRKRHLPDDVHPVSDTL